jgi:hypothetical protein
MDIKLELLLEALWMLRKRKYVLKRADERFVDVWTGCVRS